MYRTNGGAWKVMEAFCQGKPLKIGNYRSTGRVLFMYETPVLTWTSGLFIVKYESKSTMQLINEFSDVSGIHLYVCVKDYTYYLNGSLWEWETPIDCTPPIKPIYYLVERKEGCYDIKSLSHAKHLLICMREDIPLWATCIRKFGDYYEEAVRHFAEYDALYNEV